MAHAYNPYGSIEPRSGKYDKPPMKDYVEKYGAFSLGCRMSQAPKDMTTFDRFEQQTGKSHKEYAEFVNGQCFDNDLRNQLKISTTNP